MLSRKSIYLMSLLIIWMAVIYQARTAHAHYFLNCNSVDSGEIRYSDNTAYDDALDHAIDIWNSYELIYLVPDDWASFEDLVWYDVDRDDVDWAGKYYCYAYYTDEIRMNSYILDGQSLFMQKYVAAHEQGHALGLAHNQTDYSQLMWYTAVCGCNTPQSHDVGDYQEKWGP